MRHLRTITEPAVLDAQQVDAIVDRLRAVCRQAPVVLLYLHGAHAANRQGPLSDVDLAVLLAPDAARRENVAQQGELLASFQDACGRDDVDLCVLNSAGSIIKDRVVRSGRLLFARSEPERIGFETAAIKEGLDFAVFSRVYDDALFRRLREGLFLG